MPETSHFAAIPSQITQRNVRWRRFRLWVMVLIYLGLAFLVLYGRPPGNPAPAQAQARPSATLTLAGEPGKPSPTVTRQHLLTLSPSPTITGAPPSTTPAGTTPEQPAFLLEKLSIERGTIFLSIYEAGYFHLYAYHPQHLPFTRLTFGAWDDITPAASPDGRRLAFASNRNGQWDLFVLDLASGNLTQLTDTPEYDASPSWSPDSQWLVYESYAPLPTELQPTPQTTSAPASAAPITHSLDIFIRPAQGSASNPGETIRLTSEAAADYAPSWSPGGRLIAFVSNRSGDEEIWLADLDQVDNRFRNLSRLPRARDQYPAWSPDGKALAWASSADGYQTIYLMEVSSPPAQARPLGNGARPAFSPSGAILLTALSTPNHTYLTGYERGTSGLVLPAIPTQGSVSGLSWSPAELPQPLPAVIAQAAQVTAAPPWLAALTPAADLPASRQRVVELQDVRAPYPYLHDLVDESFNALRSALASRIGWDFLSTLENAYLPLTSPLFPGMLEDWLYTGRAFQLNTGAMNAGWMLVMREQYGADIYWRIYLRTRYQDGSQGMPLHELPWNFNARYSGDPRYYEQGGAYAQTIPPGYWVDLTNLAASYGWERLPALLTWRSAMPAARFNEFVFSDGLDWRAAMLELYPASALATPTAVLPPTLTPTRTPWPTRTPPPTRTSKPAFSATPSPSSSTPGAP